MTTWSWVKNAKRPHFHDDLFLILRPVFDFEFNDMFDFGLIDLFSFESFLHYCLILG